MKIQFFIFLILFNLFFCLDSSGPNGGIKLQISEDLAYDALGAYLLYINRILKSIYVEIPKFLEKEISSIILDIEDFNINMVSIKFLSDKISIQVTGLTGEIRIRKKLLFQKKNIFVLNKFNIGMNILISSKFDSKGRLIPEWKYINNPTSNINVHQDLKELVGEAENNEYSLKQKIDEAIGLRVNQILNIFLYLFPRAEILLDTQKGLYADYSLVTPVRMYNGYFVINSYRRIYNININKTQSKDIYISALPEYMNSVGKYLKLYISKVNIISSFQSLLANDTHFTMSKRVDQNKFNPNLLQRLLKFNPRNNYINYNEQDKLIIDLDLYRHLDIEIKNNNLYLIYEALILIRFDFQSSNSAPAYSSFFDCKSKIDILNGVKIEPTLSDLTYTSEVNNGINSPPSQEELDILQELKSTLFSELKDLYKQNLNFKSPLIDGNKFSSANVEYYDDYLVINFGY